MTTKARRVSQIFAGLFGALFVGEIILRILGLSFPGFIALDPHTAFAHRSSVAGWHNGENRVYVVLNRMGYNDVDWEVTKPSGVFRIAVLGDSMAEGFDVEREQTFSSVVARELGSCANFSGRRVETMNFGVGGYGTAQALLTLRHKVWAFQPDMVVLGMFGGNDIHNNYRPLQRENLYPYFLIKDGKLALDDSFLQSDEYKRRQTLAWRVAQRLSDYSRLLQLMNETKKNLKVMRMKAEETQMNTLAEGEHGLDYMVFVEPKSPNWREAWQVTEAMLDQMNREVSDKGARFLVVGLSAGIQVVPDLRVRNAATKQLGVKDLFYIERRMAAWARKSGIEYLPLAPAMAAEADQHGTYFHGGKNAEVGLGHWNEKGHQFGGHAIAEKICSMHSNNKVAVFSSNQ